MRVGSVDHRNVAVVHSVAMQSVDFVSHELCFVVCAVPRVTNDCLARTRVGPQVLGWAIEVVADNRVCRRKNVLGAAVVLLQQDGSRPAEILFELRNVADVRSSEGINTLVGVAHHSQGGRWHYLAGAVIDVGMHGIYRHG